jgi:hypothetical protein
MQPEVGVSRESRGLFPEAQLLSVRELDVATSHDGGRDLRRREKHGRLNSACRGEAEQRQ